MGVFEKAIPKYTYNLANEVVVAPAEQPYIDDIFDPILNARVRNALYEQYGNLPRAVFEGYAQLLDNTWNGNEGLFGKGMGVLSTFGRSMDKAGDIVIGGVTEGVKGLTGQGFENPLQNIFVEDEDYTGRRLLAAAANSMSQFAGGTTVNESDFGPVFSPVSTGLELALDPGILGGSVARKLAPNAAEMTPKALLKDIATADVKTAVGDIGQLLSNYDDLMARAAIDISAPGLRPAFKALRTKIVQFIPTNAHGDFVNVRKNKNVPGEGEVPPSSAGDTPNSPPTEEAQAVEELINMHDNLAKVEAQIPVTDEETFAAADRLPSQIIEDTVANGPSARLDAARAPEDAVEELEDVWKLTDTANDMFENSKTTAINEMLQRMEEYGHVVGDLNTDLRLGFVTEDLDEIRQILYNADLSAAPGYVGDVAKVLQSDESMLEALNTGVWSENEALSNLVNSILSDPKYKDSAFFKKYNSIFSISPSKIGRFNAIGTEGLDTSAKELNKIRPFGHTPEDFDDWASSDSVITSLNAFLPPSDFYGDASNAKFLKFNDSNQIDRVSKFLKILKKVYFPEEFGIKTAYEYSDALQELYEYIDKYAVIGPELNANAMYTATPKEAKFINELYKTVDDIGQHYLQRLNNMQRRSLDFTGRRTKYYAQNLANDEGINADYGSYDAWIQVLLSKVLPNAKSEDEVQAILEPILPYMQVKYKGVKRGAKYIANRSAESAERFYKEALPLLEEYISLGGNPFTNKHFIPKGFSKEKYSKMNSLLGLRGAVSDKDSKYFNKMAELVIKGKDAKVPNLKYPKATRISETYYTSTNRLVSNVSSPTEIRAVLEGDEYFIRSLKSAKAKGESVDNVYESIHKVSSELMHKAKHFGIESPEQLQKILENARTPKGKPLPHPEIKNWKRLYNAYAIEYEKAIQDIPYRAISRDVKAYSASEGYPALSAKVSQLLESKKMSPRVAGRLRDLMARESEANFIKHGHSAILNKYSSPELIEFLETYGNDGSRNLYKSTAALQFKKAALEGLSNEAVDEAIRKLKYASENFDGLDKGARMRVRNRITREYLGMPYTKAKALIDTYLEASSADTVRTKALSKLEASINTEFPVTEANIAYVKKHLIDKLEYRYRIAWEPSRENGLFYFNIHEGDPAAVIRIGDTYPIVTGDIQRMSRPGALTFSEIAKTKSPKFRSYIDYTKLVTREGFDELVKDLANAQIQMPFSTAKNTPISEFITPNLMPPKVDEISKTVEEVKQVIIDQPIEKIVEELEVPPSPAAAAADEVLHTISPEMAEFAAKGGSDEAGEVLFGKEQWDLFKQVDKARSVRSSAKAGEKATLKGRAAKDLDKAITMFNAKYSSEADKKAIKTWLRYQDAAHGDVLKASDFWDSFRKTAEFKVAYKPGDPVYAKAKAALTHNAQVLNKALGIDAVEVVTNKLTNGNVDLTIRWKVNEKRIVAAISKHTKELSKAKFVDVVFSLPGNFTEAQLKTIQGPMFDELRQLIDRMNAIAADQYATLGFKVDTSDYVHHAMKHDIVTADYVAHHLHKGTDIDKLDEITERISLLDAYRGDRGAFGTVKYDRRYRGNYWLYDNGEVELFDYDLNKVYKSLLGDGVFANTQYQTYVDLYVNDNFKISDFAKTTNDLRDVLYATDPAGKLSGNFANLELIAPRYNESGRLVGFTKFDKSSEAGLQKALNNKNTILVPATAVTHLDALLRKDARMSNKVWAFVNKHFTTPFKFGILTNPGFLLGNAGDAFLKQATTMSQKYGTSVTHEMEEVAKSVKMVINLKNGYYNSFEKWTKFVKDNDLPFSPNELIPDIVAVSPKYRKHIELWMQGKLTDEFGVPYTCTLTRHEIDNFRYWYMLQSMQHSSKSLREFQDVADMVNGSDYDVASNAFDRIVQGSGKYDPRDITTWGLLMNNPVMKAIMSSSEAIEDTMRSAAILNDLRHKKYTAEEISRYMILPRSAREAGEDLQFRVDLTNAENTMFNANFDYERMNDFMDGIGKVVPFPVFFLKNFVYWMELWMDNPQFVDHAITVQEGLWGGREEDEFETEAKGRGAVPVGGDMLPEWFKGFYKPAPLQSMFGAFSLLNNPVDDIRYRLHPAIGGAAAAINKAAPNELTTYLADPEETKYRPYSENPYERNIKASDPKFSPAEYALHRANPFEKAIQAHTKVPAKLKRDEAQLSDFLPSIFQPDF